jgi:hypothetical protein
MTIRPFDWRDLPILLRYRNRGLFFDNKLVLTRGSGLVPAGALFSSFAPATGIFTYLCSNSSCEPPLIGQLMHDSNSSCARLAFLAPECAIESPALSTLFEYMLVRIGERGAYHLLAEVRDEDPAFEVLRRNSFAIFARQRIWQLTGEPLGEPETTPWRAGIERDGFMVRSLYSNLVPGLVQQVEAPPANPQCGLVYFQGNELLAYVELKYGSRGIWVHPFIHPGAEMVPARLVDLLKNLPQRKSRPIYICVRSYQSWLEPALEDLGAEPGPRQAVMVKHLAIAKRVAQSFRLKKIEGGHPEVTAPLVRTESN